MQEQKTYFLPDPKVYSIPKARKGLKKGSGKPTGELSLFKELFLERNGVCEITGLSIDFHPISFHHILPKKDYERFRLVKKNIIVVIPEIHLMIHSGTKDKLLKKYPKAIKIFEMKKELLIEYNNLPTI